MKLINSTLTVTCIAILTTFVACQSKKISDKNLIDISKNIVSIGKPDLILQINQLDPKDIFKIDSLFLVYEPKGSEYFFYVYDSKFNKIGQFGRKGKGPGEFIYVKYGGQWFYENNCIKLWVFDTQVLKAYKIDLFSGINNLTDSLIEEVIHLPEEVLTISDCFVFDNGGGIIGRSDMISNGRYFIINKDAQNILWTSNIPDIKKHTHPSNLKLGYHAHTRIFEGKLYSAMSFSPRIDVFDLNGMIIKSYLVDVAFPPPDLTDPNFPFKPEHYEYFYNIQVENQFIYAAYFGQTRHSSKLIYNGLIDGSSILMVINHETNTYTNYEFPFVINRFCVDGDNNRIITLRYSMDDIVFEQWTLNELI